MPATAVDPALLAMFVAVAEATSFSKAATKLGITKGTVSRGIARLEDGLGVELLHRTTHRVALSTAGIALYERTAAHVHALADAVEGLPESAAAPSGDLRITVPHDFGAIVLPELLVRFSQRHPAITFDVRVTNDSVDLVSEGFDVAIRASTAMTDSTLIARRLGHIRWRAYASPGYVARRGEPRTLGAPDHDWVAFRRRMEWLRDHPEVTPRLVCDDLLMLRQILAAGGGVGLLPALVAQAHLQQGELVSLLPAVDLPDDAALYLVYPSSGQVPRKLAAFRDFVIATLPAAGVTGVRWTI